MKERIKTSIKEVSVLDLDREKHQLIYIEWVDSSREDGWIRSEQLLKAKELDVRCFSIGWLVRLAERSLTIVPHIALDPEQFCGTMIIPYEAIIDVRRL